MEYTWDSDTCQYQQPGSHPICKYHNHHNDHHLIICSPDTLAMHPVSADVALDHEHPGLLVHLAAGTDSLPELRPLLSLAPLPRALHTLHLDALLNSL